MLNISVTYNINFNSSFVEGIEQVGYWYNRHTLVEFWPIHRGLAFLPNQYTVCAWFPKGYKKRNNNE